MFSTITGLFFKDLLLLGEENVLVSQYHIFHNSILPPIDEENPMTTLNHDGNDGHNLLYEHVRAHYGPSYRDHGGDGDDRDDRGGDHGDDDRVHGGDRDHVHGDDDRDHGDGLHFIMDSLRPSQPQNPLRTE